MGIFRDLRNLGFVAIPAKDRDKRPAAHKWTNYQTEFPTDEEIDAWDKKADNHSKGSPQVGIVTGALSNLIVLDVDTPECHQWLAKHADMPVTAAVLSSPGDGINKETTKIHHYFRHPGGQLPNQQKGKWGIPGAELRADGGFIMAPPSRHPDVDAKKYDDYRYEWVFGMHPSECDIATCPTWLLKACNRPMKVNISDTDLLPPEVLDADMEGVPKGRRNDTAARLAGRWFALGLGEAETLSLLLSWNLKNQPPLPEKEVIKVCESIGAREQRNRTARMRAPSEVDKVDWYAERSNIFTALTAKFGITVTDIQKITGDDPSWTFNFSDGVLCTMTSAQIFNNNLFRQQVFSQVGVNLPAISDKKGEWGRIRQMISDAAEWKPGGMEATARGEMQVAIEDYFTGCRPEIWDDQTRPPLSYPFIYEEKCYIFVAHLLHYLQNNKGMKIALRELAKKLTVLGFQNSEDHKKKRFNGFQARVWLVPAELMPPARVDTGGASNVVPIKRF